MGLKSFVAFLILGLAVAGCTPGHCRRKADAPAEAKPLETPQDPMTMSGKSNRNQTVFVYKYDGSLQCKMGKPVSVDAMANQLKGIEIVSSTKKSDGLMHIQVCGSTTGMANVYEISVVSLKLAETRGFKKWSFE